MHEVRASRHLPDFAAPVSAFEWWRRAALLFAVYYVVGRAAALLPNLGDHSAPIGLSAGIALAALLRCGVSIWPGVWLGATLLAVGAGSSWGLATLVAAGCTSGPVLGAWWLRREGLHPAFDRRRDLWLYAAIGLGASMLVTSASMSLWQAFAGHIAWSGLPGAWMNGWLADATGALVVGIPLLTFSRAALQRALGGWRWLISILLALATFGGAAFAAVLAGPAGSMSSPAFYLPHLMLGWLAARSGLFAASVTALLLIVATVVSTFLRVDVLGWPADELTASHLAGYAIGLLAPAALITALSGEVAGTAQRWRSALDIAQIGVADWNVARGRVTLSRRWLTLLGDASQRAGRDIEAFWMLLPPDEMPEVRRRLESVRDGGTSDCHIECRMACLGGGWRRLALDARAIERDPLGNAIHIQLVARDIGELHHAREQQALVTTAFQNLHEGLVLTDADLRVLEANAAYARICETTRAEALGTVPRVLQPGEPGSELAQQQSAMRTALDSDGHWRGEFRQTLHDGTPRALQLTITAMRSDGDAIRNYVLAVADVTHAREQLDQLQRQAHFDELTRLPNRARLAQMLRTAMQTSRDEGTLLTVCFLDLDHFKPVNDRFGHDAGDRLLTELANRMRRSLRSWAGGDDIVARVGGDEFVLLLRTASLQESHHAVERVLRQLCQPYGLGVGAGPVTVSASIGATVFPLDSADAETLLRHADHAMYGAKLAGRNRYQFFDAEDARRTQAHFVALGRVQEALDLNEFCLHFQPKVDMRTAKVLGFEALLRWRHPDKGVISPAQFLPVIENTGLSVSVGNWVLQHGIERLAQWLRMGLDITVSINVSARHLQEPLFAQHLAGLLSRHQTPVAHRLIIEVLETAALADVDYTCSLIEECRTLGVRFALDDFGTGYSTFTYLKRLPVDMLKIDRSFVTNMLVDRQDLAIVEGVIGLSQTFGCAVIAEGVETHAQAQRLIEIGCDVGQGNGIAQAMPAEEVVQWIRDYKGIAIAAAAPVSG